MTVRNAKHATFAIERVYAAAPARVFAAWSSKKAKAAWAWCHEEWMPSVHEFDFRVGGRERAITGPAGGTAHIFDAIYQDIVPDERIVLAYEMHMDHVRISVSLGTAQFKPSGRGTRLIYTEQAVFLDGHDDAGSREQGTRGLFDNLAAMLEQR